MTNRDKPDTPGVHIPPPIIVFIFLALGLIANRYVQTGFGAVSTPAYYTGIGMMLLGFALGLWCAWLYHKAKTSILPHTEDSAIINTGPFAFSRNPIYLAMVLVFIGYCLFRNAPLALLFIVPTIFTLRIYVIAKEEAYLERRFGGDYLAYKQSVRRWI